MLLTQSNHNDTTLVFVQVLQYTLKDWCFVFIHQWCLWSYRTPHLPGRVLAWISLEHRFWVPLVICIVSLFWNVFLGPHQGHKQAWCKGDQALCSWLTQGGLCLKRMILYGCINSIQNNNSSPWGFPIHIGLIRFLCKSKIEDLFN